MVLLEELKGLEPLLTSPEARGSGKFFLMSAHIRLKIN